MDAQIIRQALDLPLPDFEDAVCAACAASAGCDIIVTRDPTGFRNAPLPVLDPASALVWLGSASQ